MRWDNLVTATATTLSIITSFSRVKSACFPKSKTFLINTNSDVFKKPNSSKRVNHQIKIMKASTARRTQNRIWTTSSKTIKKSDISEKTSRCAACDVGRMGTMRDGVHSSQRKSPNACSAWEITLESIAIALCASSATLWGIEWRIAHSTYLLIKLVADSAERRDTLIAVAVFCKLKSPKRV